MTCKIKTCSCRACKAGRNNCKKQIEHKARRKWNNLTRKKSIAAQSEGNFETPAITHFGGGYTD